MDAMQLRVLGPVEIAVAGQRVTVGSESQRVILAVLLAARSGVVSADRLIDALWETDPPSAARKSLHTHVSRLRRALADAAPNRSDVVATETDGYRVDLDRHDLDAERFEDLLVRARDDLDADPERAVRRFDEALALWRGRAFGELADREGVRAEAVRLDELRAAAIADRIDARLSLGHHQAVIGELEAAVAADPLSERPHGQLMLALYRSSRQADALAVYRRLQQQLSEEIGVDPSPEVQRLHEGILRQDADLASPMPATTPAPSDGGRVTPGHAEVQAPSSRVAAASGKLIGRDEDVAAVTALVAAARIVTLTGPGGVGKSSLAEAVVAEADQRFPDGAVVCALAGVRDPASVTSALVDALRVQHQGDRSAEEILLEALGTRRLLLVLDNCEHLLEPVAQVAEIIRRRCPHVTILATSREYLHLPGERVWEVAALPVPRADASASEVASTPAGELFCTRARAVEPSFELTEANAATVAQLCRRLDGIPLAIELAAARVRALALEALAARLDHRFDVLTGGSHREAGRHRTLQAMVEWSYELLTDAEAHLFDRLSVFAGPFTLTAAEQVSAVDPLTEPEVAGLLAELVDKSLVAVDRDAGGVRYRLLDTLRAYGARRLEEAGATDLVRRTHAAYHLQLVEELALGIRGPDERAVLTQLDSIFDDLRLVHAWAADDDDTDGSIRLPAALADDLVFRPRDEVFTWADRALELPGGPGHAEYPAAMAVAARGALNRGELGRARSLAGSALDLSGHDRLSALPSLYVLTTVALYEGRLDDALARADQRSALADEIGDDFHRALAGVSRVLALMYRGEVDAAALAATEARRDAEASGNHTAQAWALYGNGEALLETDPDEAAALLEQAIAAARRVERRFIEGVALVSLASVTGRCGRTDRALELFRETIAHWRTLGVHAQQLTTLRNLVELLVQVGADEPAAFLHGAVTAGATPSFGAEAERLTAAWQQLEQHLGPEAAAAAERGRTSTSGEVVDTALAHLDTLLGER